MSIVFGPISSRRFGKSLGIDLSPKFKQCNFDCLYCELKPAKIVHTSSDFPAVCDVISEVKAALLAHQNCDVLTITANGEPTLYPHLSALVKELNKIKGSLKLLILSNGSCAVDDDKLDALYDIDIVKFSLDSAVQKTFRKIDRGEKTLLVKDMIVKMAEFSAKFSGELVLEILVVKDLNDTVFEFKELNRAISLIKPHRVDISSVDRPPAYHVKGVDREVLENLAKEINCVPSVIASRRYGGAKDDYSEDEIIKMLSLRPQSRIDVDETFSEKSKQILDELIKHKEVAEVNLAGLWFYKLKA